MELEITERQCDRLLNPISKNSSGTLDMTDKICLVSERESETIQIYVSVCLALKTKTEIHGAQWIKCYITFSNSFIHILL